MTDKDIIKTLECCIEMQCTKCPMNYDDCEERDFDSLVKRAIQVFNRQQANIKKLQLEKEKLEIKLKCNIESSIRSSNSAMEVIKRQDAEIERLQKAYKQCAWERDVFAEDMKEEIKKDCSYLALDIKTIKAEAIKEFAE